MPQLNRSEVEFESNISADDIKDILGVDVIWTSSLAVLNEEEKKVRRGKDRIEDESKWTGGIWGISGSTQGPQTSR